jgi:hypothetical protein
VSVSPFSAGGSAGTWVNGNATQQWRISSEGTLIKNIFGTGGSVAHAVLYNNGTTGVGGGSVSATLQFDPAATADVRGGIASNFQDQDNFYMRRIQNTTNEWDLFKRVGGSFTKLAGGTASANFGSSVTYTLSLTNTNTASDNLSYSISGSNITTISGNVTDTTFTTGYFGLYAGNSSNVADSLV